MTIDESERIVFIPSFNILYEARMFVLFISQIILTLNPNGKRVFNPRRHAAFNGQFF